MNGNGHIDIDDLAMFALLLLSEREAATVRQHLHECPECREELQQVRKDLGVYALTVEPVNLPAGARERFMAKLEIGDSAGAAGAAQAADVKAGPVAVEPGSSRSGAGSASRVLAWIGWAAAAAILFVTFGLKQDRDALRAALTNESAQTAAVRESASHAQRVLHALTDPHAVHVSLTIPKAAATPAARATYEPKSGTLLLLASNLAPLKPQKVYELWIIPADGSKPVPVGTFAPDERGAASVLMPPVQGAIAAKAFGITIENAGGSVTPTMPILLAGSPG